MWKMSVSQTSEQNRDAQRSSVYFCDLMVCGVNEKSYQNNIMRQDNQNNHRAKSLDRK